MRKIAHSIPGYCELRENVQRWYGTWQGEWQPYRIEKGYQKHYCDIRIRGTGMIVYDCWPNAGKFYGKDAYGHHHVIKEEEVEEIRYNTKQTRPENVHVIHEDLRQSIHAVNGKGLVLDHPLVYAEGYRDTMAKEINEIYTDKVQKLNDYLDNKKWTEVMDLFEPKWKGGGFKVLDPLLNNAEYWSLLACFYNNPRSSSITNDELRSLFLSSRDQKEHFTSDEDKQAFAQFPDDFEVHRGLSDDGKDLGFSWTLNREVAKADAFEGKSKHRLITTCVRKSDVLGYVNTANKLNRMEVIITKKIKRASTKTVFLKK